MLKAIFYARFHSERGPIILHQYPRESISTSSSSSQLAQAGKSGSLHNKLAFQDISSYVIPPYELCNKAFSISSNGLRILGWPVSLEDPKYPRNRFTFNVCFVVSNGLVRSEYKAWDAVVRKTARWFKSLEEESGILSSLIENNPGEISASSDSKQEDAVQLVLKHMFDQLNAYAECCVRLSETHVLNLRVEAFEHGAQRTIKGWEVPLLVSEFTSESGLDDDLVFKQLKPHIDGVNHVRKVAHLADVELDLAQDSLSKLLSDELIMILDTFNYQAVYVPTEDMAWFVRDVEMQEECVSYILKDNCVEGRISVLQGEIVKLYLGLQHGLTLKEFCKARMTLLECVDVRRFITYGTIKGFLKRLQRFAKLTEPSSPVLQHSQVASLHNSYEDAVKKFEQAWKLAALSSGWATPPADLPPSLKTKASRPADELRREHDGRLRSYLDGQHCFDQICVEMGMSEKDVMKELKSGRFGEVVTFLK